MLQALRPHNPIPKTKSLRIRLQVYPGLRVSRECRVVHISLPSGFRGQNFINRFWGPWNQFSNLISLKDMNAFYQKSECAGSRA